MRADSQAQFAVRQVGEWIGFGVVRNLANIFNPEAVVFGGTLRDVYLVAAAQIRSRLNAIALPAARDHIRMRTPGLGHDAALIGAAELGVRAAAERSPSASRNFQVSLLQTDRVLPVGIPRQVDRPRD